MNNKVGLVVAEKIRSFTDNKATNLDNSKESFFHDTFYLPEFIFVPTM